MKASDFSSIKIGTEDIVKIYLGDYKIWPKDEASLLILITTSSEPMLESDVTINKQDNGDGTWSVEVIGATYCRLKPGEDHSGITNIIIKRDSNTLTDCSNMFNNAVNVEHIDLNSFDMSNVTNTNSMFKNCGNLVCVNRLDTTGSSDKTDMFSGCSSLTNPDSAAQTDLTDADGAIYDQECLILFAVITSSSQPAFDTLDGGLVEYVDNGDGTWNVLYRYDTTWLKSAGDRNDWTAIDIKHMSFITKAEDMFRYAENVTDVTIPSNIDTSNMTTMRAMFSHMSSLTSISGLEYFDTSNVTAMMYMFNYTKVQNLDLSMWDMSQVNSFLEILSGNADIQSISLPDSFGQVASDMKALFANCLALECINKMDTTKATAKSDMFYGCNNLTAPDSSEQSDLADADGAVYVNPNSCP